MLLESISIDGKPRGKCFAKRCRDCAHYRQWKFTDPKTQQETIDYKCSLEALYYAIPQLIGSVDGCQQATNETRNKVEAFGNASIRALDEIPKLLRIK